MKLNFPNPCRNFDPDSRRVLFWGYDSSMEISFFLDVAVLKRLYPEMTNAVPEYLKAFDTSRKRIYKVADKIYCRGGGGKGKGTYAYVLAAEDF